MQVILLSATQTIYVFPLLTVTTMGPEVEALGRLAADQAHLWLLPPAFGGRGRGSAAGGGGDFASALVVADCVKIGGQRC